MNLCINGFLLDSSEDDSLKFELDIDGSFNEEIVRLLGHQSLDAMAECEWLLTIDQISQLSSITGHPLLTDLKLFIGVEA